MINRRRGAVAVLVLAVPLALAACSGSGNGPLSSAASNLATRSPSVSLPTTGQSTPSLPTRSPTPTAEPTQSEDVQPTQEPTSPTDEPTTPTPTPTPTKTKTVTATATATATTTPTPTPQSTTATPSDSVSSSESPDNATEETSSASSAWPWALLGLAILIAGIVTVVLMSQRKRRAAWAANVEAVYARGSLLADSLTSDIINGDGTETADQATRHDADLAAFITAAQPLPEDAPNDAARPAAQRVVDSATSAQASLTQLRVASPVDRPAAQQSLATHVGGLRAALDDLRATTTPSS